jgi:adenine-specific DNA methylase
VREQLFSDLPRCATRGYTIKTFAFDLNPVAVATMKASLEVPFNLGINFTNDLRYWVEHIGQQARDKLQKYFPSTSNE